MAGKDVPEVFYKLQTDDKQMFSISKNALLQSKTLAGCIKNVPKDETSSLPIPVLNVSVETIRTVITWCEKHKNDKVPSESRDTTKTFKAIVPTWDADFLATLDNGALFDVICAANFLDIPVLMDYACQLVANMAIGKTPQELRALFLIPSDEEELLAKSIDLSENINNLALPAD